MKRLLLNINLVVMVLLMAVTLSFGQGENINLQAGNYDRDPYPAYNPTGSITGTYTIRASKSAHTFTDGQFTVNIAFPPGVVFAAGAVLPAGFTILSGQDGSSAVVIGITGNWSGTGPSAIRTLVLPIRIIGASVDQPTATSLQWLDPFINENPAGNSTGSPLNVENVLPVKLVSFTVTKEDNTAMLAWASSQETNADYFGIERSADAKQWALIGKKTAAGDSRVKQTYTFLDETPVEGANYYRLKMTDKDGTFAYSGIKNAEFQGTGVKLYPNPVSDVLFLKGVDLKSVKEVAIVNISGVTVYKAYSVSAAGINASKLTEGSYIVKVTKTDGTLSTHKVVIAK